MCHQSRAHSVSKSTDERGRLYLPKDVRERFGEEYRVVELPNYVALFPVADDPLPAVEEAVGDELDGETVEELRDRARQRSHNETAEERKEHAAGDEEGA